MSLTRRLRELLQRRETPERKEAYADMLARLARSDAGSTAPQVGERIAEFLLPNAEGRLVALSELLAHGPLVLSFFRGGWCPYCDLTLRTMQQALPGLQRAGAGFAAVWPDTGGAALQAKRTRNLALELLVDVDNAVAMRLGIVFRVPELYRRRLLTQGIDLVQVQGNGAWLLPIPATFVLTPDAVVRYRFVDADFTARPEPEELLGVVRALSTPARGRDTLDRGE